MHLCVWRCCEWIMKGGCLKKQKKQANIRLFSSGCAERGIDPEVVQRGAPGQRKGHVPGADEEVCGVAEERRGR